MNLSTPPKLLSSLSHNHTPHFCHRHFLGIIIFIPRFVIFQLLHQSWSAASLLATNVPLPCYVEPTFCLNLLSSCLTQSLPLSLYHSFNHYRPPLSFSTSLLPPPSTHSTLSQSSCASLPSSCVPVICLATVCRFFMFVY